MIDHCQCERSCLLVSITFTITIPHLLSPTKVRTHLFSTAYRHGSPKTARLQSDHASSFSAAGLMMTDDAIAAKDALTVANGMRPPTLLFSVSLIARGLTRTLVRPGGRGFLDGRTCGDLMAQGIRMAGALGRFRAVYTPHDQPLLPLPHRFWAILMDFLVYLTAESFAL
jgi:hypothetical protein